MSKWIDASLQERTVMLQQVAESKGIVDSAVEKDWWVTLTLKALFSLPCSNYMFFKGGTSLSKGWDLIKRFSEDIDLLISRQYFIDARQRAYAQCENNQQIKLLRRDSRDFIVDELCPMLAEAIRRLGVDDFTLEPVTMTPQPDSTLKPVDHDSDPTALLLHYNSIADTQMTYVPPAVKIEISCLGMDEPFKNRTITSLIYEAFPQEDDEMQMSIPTILPSRTFLEKTFLLNEEFQRRAPRSLRMSRHLYDIEKLQDTRWAADALTDSVLYTTIVEHRKRFYHVGGVDYTTDMPQCINFIPQGEMAERYSADYADMLRTYIYDKKSAPTYEQLTARLEELLQRFRNSKI